MCIGNVCMCRQCRYVCRQCMCVGNVCRYVCRQCMFVCMYVGNACMCVSNVSIYLSLSLYVCSSKNVLLHATLKSFIQLNVTYFIIK